MSSHPCRKCKTQNPDSNQYCAECGAVLAVSTSLVRAQPRTLVPFRDKFSWRWFVFAIPVILGAVVVLLTGFIVIGGIFLDSLTIGNSFSTMASRAPGLIGSLFATVFLGFFVGGWVVGAMAKGKTISEPAAASLVVLGILGGAGMTVSGDVLFLAAAGALPFAFAAGLGGYLGSRSRKKGNP